METYMPFNIRSDPEATAAYLKRTRAIPPGLRDVLIRWVEDSFERHWGFDTDPWDALDDIAVTLGIQVRRAVSANSSLIDLLDRMRSDEALLLDVVDYVLRHFVLGADKLERTLERSRSTLEIRETSDGHRYLSHRVDPVAAKAAEIVMRPDDRASHLLLAAWEEQYGLQPDPSKAHQESVRAVEAIAAPLVLPKSSTPTLGTIRASLRQGSRKWELVLDGKGDEIEKFVGMIDLIWESQKRHAPADPNDPLDVTLEQSGAALHIAIAIVQLLRSGALSPKLSATN